MTYGQHRAYKAAAGSTTSRVAAAAAAAAAAASAVPTRVAQQRPLSGGRGVSPDSGARGRGVTPEGRTIAR